MQIFLAICTHLLARTQEKTFEDVFLVRIASKRTVIKSGRTISFVWRLAGTLTHDTQHRKQKFIVETGNTHGTLASCPNLF